jgi:hypothetical protein
MAEKGAFFDGKSLSAGNVPIFWGISVWGRARICYKNGVEMREREYGLW